jgi:subtilase family serine protease
MCLSKLIRAAGVAAAFGSLTGTAIAPADATPVSSATAPALPAARPACHAARPGHARCFVLITPPPAADQSRAARIAATPAGWGARDIEAAYKLPVSRDPHQTVAIVDAYQTPGLESYLAVYRHQYGLPACTMASGCFREVNQNGQASPLPASGEGSGWDLETTLDVSMVSAACPRCQILVVEADDSSDNSLATAEDTAVRLGADVISNSYGNRENGQTQTLSAAYHHPGHTIVASAGDTGFGPASFPANLATVTAVGGTVLTKTKSKRGWAEEAWWLGGSGCSAYVPKPAWQHDTDCPMRTVADVSAVAWNVAVYDADWGGWVTLAGTSISAPLIAGIYGLAGNATTIKPGYPYRHSRSLFDVTTGSNDPTTSEVGSEKGWGRDCGFTYLCVAKKGYDAPTGLGTPDGAGAL